MASRFGEVSEISIFFTVHRLVSGLYENNQNAPETLLLGEG